MWTTFSRPGSSPGADRSLSGVWRSAAHSHERRVRAASGADRRPAATPAPTTSAAVSFPSFACIFRPAICSAAISASRPAAAESAVGQWPGGNIIRHWSALGMDPGHWRGTCSAGARDCRRRCDQQIGRAQRSRQINRRARSARAADSASPAPPQGPKLRQAQTGSDDSVRSAVAVAANHREVRHDKERDCQFRHISNRTGASR